ncbi:hypothetical protein SVAN01_10166 [Stagonosporopsis vannaccii]|nr:hypothetical protein SVAN01_10166 [Stagonosporopsis vannaccii]
MRCNHSERALPPLNRQMRLPYTEQITKTAMNWLQCIASCFLCFSRRRSKAGEGGSSQPPTPPPKDAAPERIKSRHGTTHILLAIIELEGCKRRHGGGELGGESDNIQLRP